MDDQARPEGTLDSSSTTRENILELASRASNCLSCRLSETRTNVVFGEGDIHSDLMFIGEGPGREEDLSGRPFVGRSGKLLASLIEQEMGRERSSVYIANLVKCRPPQNRNPELDEVQACASFLDGQITAISPKVIITLGAVASKALLGRQDPITILRARAYPFRGALLIPTYHPAAALRGGASVLGAMRADFALAILALEGELLP